MQSVKRSKERKWFDESVSVDHIHNRDLLISIIDEYLEEIKRLRKENSDLRTLLANMEKRKEKNNGL